MANNSRRVGGLVYKTAGLREWVDVVSTYFLSIIYKLGLSKSQVTSWLKKLTAKKARQSKVDPSLVPDELVRLISTALANIDVPAGDFLQAIQKRVFDDPGPGFRWKKGDLGEYYLIKQQRGPKSTERPLHKGAKFRDKVFIGAWWYTDTARSGAHAKLRNALKRAGGGIFHKTPAGAGFTEYFAYAIVPEERAASLGTDLLHLAEDLKAEEGDRDYRLSAARLDSLADRETVKASDTFTVPRVFKSQKFNWELNLPDVLNGRSKDQKLNSAVKQLLKAYQP